MTERGLVARVRPTWVGTRPYQGTDGRVIRVLRRPSQVNSPTHLDTYKRLVGTHGHPSREGRRVFLSAKAEPGTPAPWDPSVELRPHSDYFVGSLGDSYQIVDVPGLGKVPEFEATVSGAEALRDIQSRGFLDVSAGYVSWFVPAEEVPVDGVEVVAVGKYKNPATGVIEDFDLEGLCDPADPRIPEDMREFIGGNHLAFAVPRGRGGPEVRLLLDAARELIDAVPVRRNVRAWQLQRNIDESGVSGPGCVAMVLEAEDGPCAAVWLTETASATTYDSLESFKAIHIGNHSEGTNELLPLVIGQAFVPPSEQPEEVAPVDDGAAAQENNAMDPSKQQPPQSQQPPPNGAPPPDPNKPASTPDAPPPGEDYKKLYEQVLAERDAALARVKQLEEMLAAAEAAKTAADAAKGAAEAKADALLEEIKPHRERALTEQRAEVVKILRADGELAEKIGKATADELPEIAVRAYFEARPEAAALVDNLEGKLKTREYVRARFDLMREQAGGAAPPSTTGVSDSFSASFPRAPATPKNDRQQLTGQARLDEMQRNGV